MHHAFGMFRVLQALYMQSYLKVATKSKDSICRDVQAACNLYSVSHNVM